MQGRYRIVRDGRTIGEERFTITSTASVWRARGFGRLEGPAELRYGYALEVDEENAEPLALSVWIEMLDERRSVEGRRDREGFLEVRARGIGGEGARRVPYARGTVVDSEISPVFKTLALSLLLPALELGSPVELRAVVFSPPRFDPVVTLLRLVLRGAEGGVSKIEMESGGSRTALWVRSDGLPVRARVFAGGGGPTEMILETE